MSAPATMRLPAIGMPPGLGWGNIPPRRWLWIGLSAIGAAIVLWWLLSGTTVEERDRNEDVEMFDLAVPPPPPPPPEEQQVVQEKTEIQPEQAVQPIQRDPLTPAQATSPNPPAGDLTSLLQDPTAGAGAFVGGVRGQGGSGSGPLIGGVGRGGAAGASRAYAELVQRQLIRHLRKRPDLAAAQFGFQVRVRVSPTGALEILGISGVRPADLEAKLSQALRSLTRIDTPPPAGVPNQITLQLNQA